ncbi:MAG: methyl-accepting chemotaxis protein [Lachnospiraceae bacterium]|nr:methyl-accepting chemotaxis protein [Lachnospiraceae bacterium]
MKSLKGRLVSITCLIMLLCLALTASISYGIASRQIQAESVDRYSLLTEMTSSKINAWLAEQTQLVTNQKNAMEIIGNYDIDYLISYLTPIVVDYNKDGYIYDLYFTSTSNQMASGSGYVPDGTTDFTKRDWYAGACETDDLYFSTPYLDADSGRLVITISTKVMNGDTLMGVLATDIFVDTLIEIVNGQQTVENSYLFIVDSKNGIVNHPNEAYGYVEDEPISLSDVEGGLYDSLIAFLDSPETSPVSIKDYDGTSRSFFAHRVDSCGWHVVAAISNQVMNQSRSSIMMGFLIALVISIALGSIITVVMASRIVKPISLLSATIASGDFSKDVPVTSRDEIGALAQGFNGLMKKMRALLEITVNSVESIQSFAKDLNQVADQLVTNAGKVNTEMESITDAMEVQYDSVEQGKIQLNKFDEHIKAFGDSYHSMEQTIEDVLGKLNDSVVAAKKLENSTKDSKENMQVIFQDIRELEKLSESITEIVSTISSISGQTNLLALNASIEAARAGEVGRGFAVVAEEIRVLSEQTSTATTNISELISNIRSRISQTVSSINDSTEAFANNTENSQVVLSVFTQLKDCLEDIGRINQTLSSAMSVFLDSKEHINQSFGKIDDNVHTCLSSTTGAKTLSKEQADWVGSLEAQSNTLKELAGQLKETTRPFTV